MGDTRNMSSADGGKTRGRTADIENPDFVPVVSSVFSGVIEGAVGKLRKQSKNRSEDVAKGYIRDMSWNRRILVFLWVIIIYGSNAVVLRYSIVSFLQIRSSISFMTEIIQNWQQGAITDIVVAETCPSGYEIPYSASFGTKAGCDCSSVATATLASNNIDCFVCVGTCNAVQSSAGCQDVASMGPYNLTFFSVDEGNYSSLCVQRASYTYDVLAPLSTDSGGCSSGYQLCSNNTNSLNNLCIPESDACPINKLTFEDVSGDPSYTCTAPDCIVIFKNTSTTSSVRLMRILRNASDATPLSDIGLNQDSMCLSQNSLNEDPDRVSGHPFVLDNNTRTVCNQEGSVVEGWNDFVLLKESELMLINGIYDNIKNVPGYDIDPGILDYNWVLSYRSYIPFLSSCRQYISRFTDNNDFVIGLNNIHTLSMYINVGSAILSIIVLSSYQMALLFGLAHYTLCFGCLCKHPQAKLERRYLNVEGINFCLSLLCQGAQLGFTVWQYIFSLNQTEFYETLCSESCTISPWIDQICGFSDEFTKVFNYNFIIMIVLGSLMLSEIVIITAECCLARRARKARSAVAPTKPEDGINSLVDLDKKGEQDSNFEPIDSTRNMLKFCMTNIIEKMIQPSPSNTVGSPRNFHNDTSTQILQKKEIHTGSSTPRITKVANKLADAMLKRPFSQERSMDEGNSENKIETINSPSDGSHQLMYASQRINKETMHKLFINTRISKNIIDQSEGGILQLGSAGIVRKDESPLPRPGWYTPRRRSTKSNLSIEWAQTNSNKEPNDVNDFLSRFRPQNTPSNQASQGNSVSPSDSASNTANDFFKKFMPGGTGGTTETQPLSTFSSLYNTAGTRMATMRPNPLNNTFKTLRQETGLKSNQKGIN